MNDKAKTRQDDDEPATTRFAEATPTPGQRHVADLDAPYQGSPPAPTSSPDNPPQPPYEDELPEWSSTPEEAAEAEAATDEEDEES